jgi:hypothetical protein
VGTRNGDACSREMTFNVRAKDRSRYEADAIELSIDRAVHSALSLTSQSPTAFP